MNNETRLIFIEYNIIVLIFIMITLTGGMLNTNVMIHNNGIMPVMTNEYEINTTTHQSFTTQEIKQLPRWYLADILNIKIAIISIGDVLILTGILMVTITNIKIMKLKRKIKKC